MVEARARGRLRGTARRRLARSQHRSSPRLVYPTRGIDNERNCKAETRGENVSVEICTLRYMELNNRSRWDAYRAYQSSILALC